MLSIGSGTRVYVSPCSLALVLNFLTTKWDEHNVKHVILFCPLSAFAVWKALILCTQLAVYLCFHRQARHHLPLNSCLMFVRFNQCLSPKYYILSGYLYPRHLCRGVYSFRLDVCPFVRSYVRSFVRSLVRVFVRSLLSVTFVEFTSKFLVKVSLSEYISLTTHWKAFIFEPWVPERVSFYTMSFCPRVDAPGWG